jgi:hypothetical protein
MVSPSWIDSNKSKLDTTLTQNLKFGFKCKSKNLNFSSNITNNMTLDSKENNSEFTNLPQFELTQSIDNSNNFNQNKNIKLISIANHRKFSNKIFLSPLKAKNNTAVSFKTQREEEISTIFMTNTNFYNTNKDFMSVENSKIRLIKNQNQNYNLSKLNKIKIYNF